MGMSQLKKARDDIVDALAEIKGGMGRHGRAAKALSIIFLSLPDPTMVSTGIGASILLISRIAEARNRGIARIIDDTGVELARALEELRIMLNTRA